MNASSESLKSNISSNNNIQIVYPKNTLKYLQSTITKLSEVTNLPIKIICGAKDKYVVRQQINQINCQSKIYMDEELCSANPAIIITFQS